MWRLTIHDAGNTDIIGDSLDHLIGSWSADDQAEFEAAIEALEQVDPTLWS